VSSARGSIPLISLVLFGLAGAAACSGSNDPKAAHIPASDAGAAKAAQVEPLTPEKSLAVVRQLAVDRPSLKHLSFETPSALRLHGTELLPRLVDPAKPFAIDAKIPAKYGERLSVWPIGKKSLSLSLRPLVGGNSVAETTDDGHAIYHDVYGHADIVRSLDDSSLHETIILRDRESPEYMNWELALGDKSLKPVEVEHGEVVMVDGKGVGRIKISAATLVGADGKERHASLSVDQSQLALHIDQRDVEYPAAVTFSVSTPRPGEQFATAPVQIKGGSWSSSTRRGR